MNKIMRALELEVKKSRFNIIIDSLGNDPKIRRAQIEIAKERDAFVYSFCFNYPKDFVLHLNTLRSNY